MTRSKSEIYDKLELIEGMVKHNELYEGELKSIWEWLNDAANHFEKYFEKNGVRDRK